MISQIELTVKCFVGLGKGVDVGGSVREFKVGNDAKVVVAVVSVLQAQADDRQIIAGLSSGVVGMLKETDEMGMR